MTWKCARCMMDNAQSNKACEYCGLAASLSSSDGTVKEAPPERSTAGGVVRLFRLIFAVGTTAVLFASPQPLLGIAGVAVIVSIFLADRRAGSK